MAKEMKAKAKSKKTARAEKESASRRKFPHHTLEGALPLAQAIADEAAGMAMNRLLLADALGLKPGSSNFRDILSSAFKYGLTNGTEKADAIGLTDAIGKPATQREDAKSRTTALRTAAVKPAIFVRFLTDYRNKKLPSEELFPKILALNYGIPSDIAPECARLITANARFTGMLRDIGGSPHVLLDDQAIASVTAQQEVAEAETEAAVAETPRVPALEPSPPFPPPSDERESASHAKPIFIGHGKNTVPLHKVEALLAAFQIPHKVTVKEANLGRPIPQKVKETMTQCGSAILIFTKDEQFFDASGGELWRPSENVVHELGAASFAYGDRLVIFKEKGLYFPTNFQSIGYIEFEVDSIESKTAELLKELIGFGLVKVTPT